MHSAHRARSSSFVSSSRGAPWGPCAYSARASARHGVSFAGAASPVVGAAVARRSCSSSFRVVRWSAWGAPYLPQQATNKPQTSEVSIGALRVCTCNTGSSEGHRCGGRDKRARAPGGKRSAIGLPLLIRYSRLLQLEPGVSLGVL